MFDVIKANVSLQEAQKLYPNDYIILLKKPGGDVLSVGDVIFLGTEDEICEFADNNEPGEGYAFCMLEGYNFKTMAPLIEVL